MDLLINCLCGKKHLLKIEKEDLTWERVDADEREFGIETTYKASITLRCFKCGNDIKIDFYIYEYPEGTIEDSRLDYKGCNLDKNIEIETLFGDCYSNEEETLGNHLRNLLTPYKCLLEAIKSDDPKVLTFIRTRKDFQEGLDRLIEFSKIDIMENTNYEKISKE